MKITNNLSYSTWLAMRVLKHLFNRSLVHNIVSAEDMSVILYITNLSLNYCDRSKATMRFIGFDLNRSIELRNESALTSCQT